MNRENNIPVDSVLDELTKTLLYEGYSLYPYRASALKNKKPIPFGVVFPESYCVHNENTNDMMQTQCIVTGNNKLSLEVSIKFLHLVRFDLLKSEDGNKNQTDDLTLMDGLNNKSVFLGWQAVEREVHCNQTSIDSLLHGKLKTSFAFDATTKLECILDDQNKPAGKQSHGIKAINGAVEIFAEAIEGRPNSYRATVRIVNKTNIESPEQILRDDAMQHSFISAHTILKVASGNFVSDQDPAPDWQTEVNRCENLNTWPVLIDDTNSTMLSSPIILYDYPKINPGSKGDLFDSTEIEEALWLHVNLLTDNEKQQVNDPKIIAMMEKASNMTPDELINLHDQLKNTVQQ